MRQQRLTRGGQLAVLLVACISACRHRSDGTPTPALQAPAAHFLDQNYIFTPKKPERLIYEAQAAANIVVVQTLDEATRAVRNDVTPQWHRAHSFIVTPLFVIRQLDDSSAAVRTPSFMPKGTYQRYWLRRTDAVDSAGPNITEWKHINLVLTDLVFGHYSNGQAGCFYEQQRFVARGNDFECEWINSDSSDRRINQSDGSFSTWYVRAGVGAERMWISGAAGAPVRTNVGALFSAQYHLPFMTEDPQEPLYGDWRLRALFEAEHRVRAKAFGFLLRGAGMYEWARSGPGVPRSHWSIEGSFIPDGFYGFGVFVRRHAGQDYYNIAFTNRLNVWQWGVTFNIDRPDRFPR